MAAQLGKCNKKSLDSLHLKQPHFMACKLYLNEVVFFFKDLYSSVKFNYNLYCSITDIIK